MCAVQPVLHALAALGRVLHGFEGERGARHVLVALQVHGDGAGELRPSHRVPRTPESIVVIRRGTDVLQVHTSTRVRSVDETVARDTNTKYLAAAAAGVESSSGKQRVRLMTSMFKR